MKTAQESVRQFMIKAGQLTPVYPQFADQLICKLRLELHQEEAVVEFAEAVGNHDLVAIADSIADSLVVVLGTAVAFGIDIEPIFNEVMRSNMTKFIDGHRAESGKWIKGPSYTPANIAPILKTQQCNHMGREMIDQTRMRCIDCGYEWED